MSTRSVLYETMLRITKQTDYGILLLTHLASRWGSAVATARDIAADTRLPVPMVSKILKLLAREGVLLSQRGAKGGYALARPASQISVGRVIEILEGPLGITECAPEHSGDCEHESHCPLLANWQRINAAVVGALDGITLDEMTRPLPGQREDPAGTGDTGCAPRSSQSISV